jgi:Type II secretion system (T2SS), protein E, N-terminal domain
MIAEHIFLTTPKAPRLAADVPFPTLSFDPTSDWEWPKPPYASDDPRPPMVGAPEPCRVEFVDGRVVEGELVAMYPERLEFVFRRSTTEPTVALKFALICRISLQALWDVRRAGADSPAERFGQEMTVREYMADFGGVRLLNGRTMGVVERDYGWFLYAPVEEHRTIMRVFIPSAVCKELEFAKTTQEKAAEHWVSTPEELLAAVAAQARAKVLPLGEALVDLGLISRTDVDRVLAQYSRNSDKPLGERLVEVGLLTRSDLQTALAHKMGYPIVDLMRFPIDINAVRKVPHRVLTEQRAMPLMQYGAHLYVAVDDLQSIPQVQALRSLQGLTVVAVLAPQAALRLALAGLTQRLGSDPWADNVSSYV